MKLSEGFGSVAHSRDVVKKWNKNLVGDNDVIWK
jgi:hypothetical protein